MAQPQLAGPATEFTVLAAEGQRVGAAEQAIRNAGGTVVNTNTAVGLITAAASGFTERVSANRAVFGAAKAKSIGSVPKDKAAPKPDVVEKEAHGSGARNAWGLKVGAFGSFPDRSARRQARQGRHHRHRRRRFAPRHRA
jgi:hypothetical protein